MCLLLSISIACFYLVVIKISTIASIIGIALLFVQLGNYLLATLVNPGFPMRKLLFIKHLPPEGADNES